MKFYFRNLCIAGISATVLFGCKPQTNPNDQNLSAVRDTSTVTSDNTGLKVAFIYGDSINEHYNFLIDAQAELESEQARMDRQMQNKLNKAQARASELQKQAPTMTQDEMQQAQRELQSLDMEMQQHQEKLTTDYRKRESELQKEYIDKIDTFLAKFNENGKYDVILNYQQGGNILLINKAFDITDEVLKGLNQEYQNQIDKAGSEKDNK